MKIPFHPSIMRMPVHVARRADLDGQKVRAAPIADAWPGMPGLTPPLVVVQVEAERHAVPVTEELYDELGARTPDALLVVAGNGSQGWVRRVEFEAQFAPVDPGRRA